MFVLYVVDCTCRVTIISGAYLVISTGSMTSLICPGGNRRLRALGYGAPAEQSTGANGVSEADERLAKGGTADGRGG